MYNSLDVAYLTDESDTIMAYEKRGRENTPSVSSYESGMQALQNMERIPQVEAMHGESSSTIVFPFAIVLNCLRHLKFIQEMLNCCLA